VARNRILVVDDDVGACFGIRDYLESHGFELEQASSVDEAMQAIGRFQPDAVILDHHLPDGTALDVLAQIQQTDTHVPVIVLTAYGSIELAVDAIKLGAEQFLTKPVDLATLLVILRRVLETERSRRKERAHALRDARTVLDPFIGRSEAMRRLAVEAEPVARSASPILILGETGTGKGVLARWLHQHSAHPKEAFVDINCAGLTREFLETELFGHQKGAFTGAVTAKPGLFEVAHNGTLFLDEIGDMDIEVQPKLLKAIEEKRFRRLGDVRERAVDVRLIAATHRDLAALAAENKFRRDLYYRINTFRLTIPPLRERKEDIPLLARDLLARLCAERGKRVLELDEGAERAALEYRWPGNIRELRNVLERTAVLCDGDVVRRRDLSFEGELEATRVEGLDPHLTLEQLERRHIERVLREEQGHVERGAKRLGISRSSLYQKINKYHIGRIL